MRKIWFIFSFCALLVSDSIWAQNATDSLVEQSGIVFYTDPRLETLFNTWRTRPGSGITNRVGTIRSGRGFRVQIYNGNDRNKANEVKLDFMRRYPNIRVYLSYIQPQYRVKVGDYRTRAEAREMYNQLSQLYTPVIIVPDIIVINTFRDDQ